MRNNLYVYSPLGAGVVTRNEYINSICGSLGGLRTGYAEGYMRTHTHRGERAASSHLSSEPWQTKRESERAQKPRALVLPLGEILSLLLPVRCALAHLLAFKALTFLSVRGFELFSSFFFFFLIWRSSSCTADEILDSRWYLNFGALRRSA